MGAQFILKVLLGLPHDDPKHGAATDKASFRWLAAFSTNPDASYVLVPFLKREISDPTQRSGLLSAILIWLDANWDKSDTSWVLKKVIFWPDAPPSLIRRIAKLLMERPWDPEFGWKLSRLLTRKPPIEFDIWARAALVLADRLHARQADRRLIGHLGGAVAKRLGSGDAEEARSWHSMVADWRSAKPDATATLIDALILTEPAPDP